MYNMQGNWTRKINVVIPNVGMLTTKFTNILHHKYTNMPMNQISLYYIL